MQIDLKNESKCKGVYSRNDLPKAIEDLSHVINLDVYKSVQTH